MSAWTVCLMSGGCAPPSSEETPAGRDTLMIFHNGMGSMCLDALNWLADVRSEYPDLIIEEHLTTDSAGLAYFQELRAQYEQSQGVSASFGYLPVIFFQGQAFSGFNDQVRQALAGLIGSRNAPPT
ncbi:MAG: hypothetical protein KA354_06485 [Phycisphaerae bacterium]|nr:hypothetical protein [Phycisphaerae bacterium]